MAERAAEKQRAAPRRRGAAGRPGRGGAARGAARDPRDRRDRARRQPRSRRRPAHRAVDRGPGRHGRRAVLRLRPAGLRLRQLAVHAGRGAGARLAMSGIRLVIDEFRTDVTKTRKDGSAGKLRIDYGDAHRARGAGQVAVEVHRRRQDRRRALRPRAGRDRRRAVRLPAGRPPEPAVTSEQLVVAQGPRRQGAEEARRPAPARGRCVSSRRRSSARTRTAREPSAAAARQPSRRPRGRQRRARPAAIPPRTWSPRRPTSRTPTTRTWPSPRRPEPRAEPRVGRRQPIARVGCGVAPFPMVAALAGCGGSGTGPASGGGPSHPWRCVMAKRRPVLTEQQREQRRAEQRELVVASIEQLRSAPTAGAPT